MFKKKIKNPKEPGGNWFGWTSVADSSISLLTLFIGACHISNATAENRVRYLGAPGFLGVTDFLILSQDCVHIHLKILWSCKSPTMIMGDMSQMARFTWPTQGTPGSCRPQMGPIHLCQEIAILEFPTSDCFQNEAICDNKMTAVAAPLEMSCDAQKYAISFWSSRRARISLRILIVPLFTQPRNIDWSNCLRVLFYGQIL